MAMAAFAILCGVLFSLNAAGLPHRRLALPLGRRLLRDSAMFIVLGASALFHAVAVPNTNGEECEYSILPVMSELSTVRCDRALGLWIAGTRASSVDEELPWRSSGRAAVVASTPGSRAQAATEGGFLGLRHKTKQADGG